MSLKPDLPRLQILNPTPLLEVRHVRTDVGEAHVESRLGGGEPPTLHHRLEDRQKAKIEVGHGPHVHSPPKRCFRPAGGIET